jgi:RND family efflux transporter MFP subunit
MKKYIPKIFLILILVLLVAGAVLMVRHRKEQLESMERPMPPTLPVSTEMVEKASIDEIRHYMGIIEPVVSAKISSQVTGALKAVNADTGDMVGKNDLIAVVDDSLLQKELAGLKAELSGALADLEDRKQRYERRRDLLEKGHVNEESMEAAQSAFLAARSRVARLRAEIEAVKVSIEYTRLRAPFKGVITKRIKDPGDLVMPGQSVFQMEDPAEGYKVLISLDPQTALKTNPMTRVRLTGKSHRITETRIDRIYPAADENRLAIAEIRFDNRPFDMPSGSFLSADLIFSIPEALTIPRRAALEFEGQWKVFILKNGQRVEPADILVMGVGRDRIAVSSKKLQVGDRVVVGDESMLIRLGPQTRIVPMESQDAPEAG